MSLKKVLGIFSKEKDANRIKLKKWERRVLDAEIKKIQNDITKRRKNGISLGEIVQWLENLNKQMLAEWKLRDPRVNINSELCRFVENERSQLFSIMSARNLEGLALERKGQIEQAIELYEANVKDRFSATRPYDRLRIIYTRQKRFDDAIRVCEAATKNLGQEQSVQEFMEWLVKLEEKRAQQAAKQK